MEANTLAQRQLIKSEAWLEPNIRLGWIGGRRVNIRVGQNKEPLRNMEINEGEVS